jgi:hypothetical protein
MILFSLMMNSWQEGTSIKVHFIRFVLNNEICCMCGGSGGGCGGDGIYLKILFYLELYTWIK